MIVYNIHARTHTYTKRTHSTNIRWVWYWFTWLHTTYAHCQNNNDYIFSNENAIFQWFSIKVIADDIHPIQLHFVCLPRNRDGKYYSNLLHLAFDASELRCLVGFWVVKSFLMRNNSSSGGIVLVSTMVVCHFNPSSNPTKTENALQCKL